MSATIKRKHLDCILLSHVVKSKKEGGAGYGTDQCTRG